MNRTEIENRIKAIEKSKFYLEMKDRWSHADFAQDNKYRKELADLRTMLKELEEN